MKRKILLLGAGGQLGKSISSLCGSGDILQSIQLIALSHADLDVTSETNVMAAVKNINPDYVINAAAYTAVDAAEDNHETCYAINADAPKYIAKACNKCNARMIHISTDYVYDGDIKIPHPEDETPSPIGVYATSKLMGENYISENCDNAVVLRTSWLYSPFGKSFVKTIGKYSFSKSEISVVADQCGNPTNALDLANAIIDIILSEYWTPGIFNFSNAGIVSWYDFAIEIVSALGNADKCIIKPIESADYPAKAKRPNFSALNCDKIREIYGIEQKNWRDSLNKFIIAYPDCFNND
ncbi:MAG: dTDP-4-dehydrorhamnose reductase [Muribaculaceae bacterium]|nr:dTDP-4-dehydrorhamnose reductase [Muribaculaceae bacterium]